MSHLVNIHGVDRHRHGWRPSLPGAPRPPEFQASRALMAAAPVDLRDFAPAALDQGAAGTCAAHAIRYAEAVLRARAGMGSHNYSRKMLYWLGRAAAGLSTVEDTGCTIDGIVEAAREGACDESVDPYTDDVAALGVPPTPPQFELSEQFRLGEVASCSDLSSARAALAAGHPVVCGVTLFEGFMDLGVAATGHIPMPTMGEAVVGGHAQVLLHDDLDSAIWALNSWSTGWGAAYKARRGWAVYPYEYLASAASDYRAIISLV